MQLKSATHQKIPTQNMKGREDNTDDRKKQGQHNGRAQTMDRQGQDRQRCLHSTSHTDRH